MRVYAGDAVVPVQVRPQGPVLGHQDEAVKLCLQGEPGVQPGLVSVHGDQPHLVPGLHLVHRDLVQQLCAAETRPKLDNVVFAQQGGRNKQSAETKHSSQFLFYPRIADKD